MNDQAALDALATALASVGVASRPATSTDDQGADLVAEAGPLIATKLQALPNRSMAKEATDLLDIRLMLDFEAGRVAREQLATAHPQLKADVALHAQRWFTDRAERSLRLVQSTAPGSDLDLDTIKPGRRAASRCLRHTVNRSCMWD